MNQIQPLYVPVILYMLPTKMQTLKRQRDAVSRSTSHSIQKGQMVQIKSLVQMPVYNPYHGCGSYLGNWKHRVCLARAPQNWATLVLALVYIRAEVSTGRPTLLLLPAAKKIKEMHLLNLSSTCMIGFLGFLVSRFGLLLFPLCKKAQDFKGSQLGTTERKAVDLTALASNGQIH